MKVWIAYMVASEGRTTVLGVCATKKRAESLVPPVANGYKHLIIEFDVLE